MKLFIWHCVDGLTNAYHSGGGVTVCDDTLDNAREQLKGKIPRDNSETCEALLNEPDRIYEVGEAEKDVIIFPDQGCCG